MTDDEPLVAATYAYRHEAEFAHETLRAAGIEAALIADDAGGAYAGMAFTVQARLLVARGDLARAQALLGKTPEGEEPPTPEN